MAQFIGAHFLNPIGFVPPDPARRRWSQGLSQAIAGLQREVVAERLRIIAEEDVSRELASLHVPVVVVEFSEDLVVGRSATSHLASCCASPIRVSISGPHFALETRPRECATALAPHLARFFEGKVANA